MRNPQIDAVAIRLDPLGDIAGSRLKDFRPIVCFAQQGLEGARLPAASDALSDGYSIDPISLHRIERVIFIIDRSESMQARLHAGTNEEKFSHVQNRIRSLTNEYFQPGTEISLVQFDNSALQVDCGTVHDGALTRMSQSLSEQWGGGYTNFSTPLTHALEILRADRVAAARERPNALEHGIRSLLLFLTDGQDNCSKEIAPIVERIRDENAATFICGVGEDYEMARIIEIASHAGAASWSHVPVDHGAPDVFEVQLRGILSELEVRDHYMKIIAGGDHTRLTAVTPSLRGVVPGTNTIYAGYSGETAGLLFERNDNILLSLSAGRHVADQSPFKQEIPILDATDAHAHFERIQDSQRIMEQFLIHRALQKRDHNLLQELVKRNPELETLLGPAIRDIKQRGPSDFAGSHSIHSAMSVTGNSLRGHSHWGIETERTGQGHTQHLYHPHAEASGQGRQVADLFSGQLGPLDVPPRSVAPANPDKLDARVYDAAVPIVSQGPRLELPPSLRVVIEGKRCLGQVALDGLLDGKEYVFGRGTPKQDDDAHWMRVTLTGDDSISRVHFKIFGRDNKYYIRDLGSRNGTFLNGHKLNDGEEVELSHNDAIKLPGVRTMHFFAPGGETKP